MPIREYQVRHGAKGCALCAHPFERIELARELVLKRCPECGAPVRRVYSVPAIGASKSGFDQRAKAAGFHQLKRISKGEYEKQY